MSDETSMNTESLLRSLRIILILDGCRSVGIRPVNVDVVHSLAYLTDALAPLWRLPLLDAQILKQAGSPWFPALQRDLDRLVGRGVVAVTRLDYRPEGARDWRLDADYELIENSAGPILRKLDEFESTYRMHALVREVVYAASAFGPEGIERLNDVDATYADPLVDYGGLIDMSGEPGSRNPTAAFAQRFAALAPNSRTLGEGELLNLYVRHLYQRMRVA